LSWSAQGRVLSPEGALSGKNTLQEVEKIPWGIPEKRGGPQLLPEWREDPQKGEREKGE